jgi:hypothetical protein
MQSGAPICRLRASARPISDSGYSGLQPYPTCKTADARESVNTTANRKPGSVPWHDGDTLVDAARLAIYPTCRKTDGDKGIRTSAGAIAEFDRKGTGSDLPTICSLATYPTPDHNRHGNIQDEAAILRRLEGSKASGSDKRQLNLEDVASLAPYPTPMAGSPATEDYNEAGNTDYSRKIVAMTIGADTTSCPSETAKRGVLNPELSRWLMGFPVAWGLSGGTAMRSCLKSRRSSSKRSSNADEKE